MIVVAGPAFVRLVAWEFIGVWAGVFIGPPTRLSVTEPASRGFAGPAPSVSDLI
jgi:hypothetical protein